MYGKIPLGIRKCIFIRSSYQNTNDVAGNQYETISSESITKTVLSVMEVQNISTHRTEINNYQ